MSIVIPDEVLQTTHRTASEFMQEITVWLYSKEKLTLGQASRLAGMSQLRFQCLLARRKIPVHYDTVDFEADLKTLLELERL